MRLVAKIDKFGRILVPQKLRLDLNLKPGSEVVFSYDERSHKVELSTRQQAFKEAQAEFSAYNPKGELWSEELLEDRRREMESEKLKS
jgi:AbrB family looped-hinge helix DNA binding protein